MLASIAGVLLMGTAGVRNGLGALLVSGAVVPIALQATKRAKGVITDDELAPGLLLAFTAVICGLSGPFWPVMC